MSKTFFPVTILFFLLLCLLGATPPMPSDADMTGCAVSTDSLLLAPYASSFYQGIQEYSIHPCGDTPFHFQAFNVEVIKANAALHPLAHHLVRARAVKTVIE